MELGTQIVVLELIAYWPIAPQPRANEAKGRIPMRPFFYNCGDVSVPLPYLLGFCGFESAP